MNLYAYETQTAERMVFNESLNKLHQNRDEKSSCALKSPECVSFKGHSSVFDYHIDCLFFYLINL